MSTLTLLRLATDLAKRYGEPTPRQRELAAKIDWQLAGNVEALQRLGIEVVHALGKATDLTEPGRGPLPTDKSVRRVRPPALVWVQAEGRFTIARRHSWWAGSLLWRATMSTSHEFSWSSSTNVVWVEEQGFDPELLKRLVKDRLDVGAVTRQQVEEAAQGSGLTLMSEDLLKQARSYYAPAWYEDDWEQQDADALFAHVMRERAQEYARQAEKVGILGEGVMALRGIA